MGSLLPLSKRIAMMEDRLRELEGAGESFGILRMVLTAEIEAAKRVYIHYGDRRGRNGQEEEVPGSLSRGGGCFLSDRGRSTPSNGPKDLEVPRISGIDRIWDGRTHECQ